MVRMILTAILLSALVHGDVIINEIMYNPSNAASGGGTTDHTEFVEIYNTGSTTVDISGWVLSDGEGELTVNAGSSILSQEYLIFAMKPDSLIDLYGYVPMVNYTSTGSMILSNSGEEITLYDNAKAVIDAVEYDDTLEWGSDYEDDNTRPDHDGDGASLERIDPFEPGNDPSNWESSTDEASDIPDDDWPGHYESWGTPSQVNSVSVIGLQPYTWCRIKISF